MRRPALSIAAVRIFLLSCSIFVVGCQSEEQPSSWSAFDGQRAFAEVEALVQISPRDAGTPGGRKAAEHLLQRLMDFGITTEIDTFQDQTPAGEKIFHNVIGRVQGKSDRWIILGSHFDTMPGIENFQGANDSGSSTGILLEIARMLADQKPEVGILFAFFDGEEGIAHYIPGDGLHGSRHMAQKLKESGEKENIQAMILLDMVGDKDLHFTIPANSARQLVKAVLNAAHATGHRDHFSLSRNLLITDDHVPFLEIGIPAIDIIDFKFGSKPGQNDHWHTEADNLENISVESLKTTGDILIETLKGLSFK